MRRVRGSSLKEERKCGRKWERTGKRRKIISKERGRKSRVKGKETG